MNPIRGIIPPMVTPLLSENKLDESGLEKLIEHLISGGVHGLFILGTTGEATSLGYDLRKEFIRKTCALVNKRVPVLAGITDTCFSGSLEMALASKQAGADALVISAPYYLPISQDEFTEYLDSLVPHLELPFLLYNMPGCTKFDMSVDTIKKARELGATGIKDSSGSITKLYSLIEEFKDTPDFSILSGTETFIPETLFFGGHGAVAGGAVLFPRLFSDWYEAALANDLNRVTLLRDVVIQIEKKIYDIDPNASKYVRSIKCALSVMGICSDYVALPFRKFDESKRRQLEQNLKEIDYYYKEKMK